MIFVTVGTHEQPFDRLIEYMDNLVMNEKIQEDVIIQIGFSTYIPKYCKWAKMYSYSEMMNNISEAHIVITHGGPSSFIMPLQIGKTPIVVPRKREFNEHVNNHQVDFTKAVAERMGVIVVVEDLKELDETIKNYDRIVEGLPREFKSNNANFNNNFEKIVREIMN